MLLNKFLKGTFNKRPMFPKYSYTWYPKLVLDLLQKWSNTNISLKLLTFKAAMLLMLLSARRGQSIIDIDIQNIYLSKTDVMITLNKLCKTSTTHFHEPPIRLRHFNVPEICIVTILRMYLEKTASLRGEEKQLFICYVPLIKELQKTLCLFVNRVLTVLPGLLVPWQYLNLYCSDIYISI